MPRLMQLQIDIILLKFIICNLCLQRTATINDLTVIYNYDLLSKMSSVQNCFQIKLYFTLCAFKCTTYIYAVKIIFFNWNILKKNDYCFIISMAHTKAKMRIQIFQTFYYHTSTTFLKNIIYFIHLIYLLMCIQYRFHFLLNIFLLLLAN